MIFVDTGAWYALMVPSDENNRVATAWHVANQYQQFITTDYIMDETLILMRARNMDQRALTFGQQLLTSDKLAQLHFVTDGVFMQAWDVFRTYSDKGWSFTDCVSFAVMQRLGITTAFAFDHHFRQFGTIQVVP